MIVFLPLGLKNKRPVWTEVLPPLGIDTIVIMITLNLCVSMPPANFAFSYYKKTMHFILKLYKILTKSNITPSLFKIKQNDDKQYRYKKKKIQIFGFVCFNRVQNFEVSWHFVLFLFQRQPYFL